jgi:hypothetical protein
LSVVAGYRRGTDSKFWDKRKIESKYKARGEHGTESIRHGMTVLVCGSGRRDRLVAEAW